MRALLLVGCALGAAAGAGSSGSPSAEETCDITCKIDGVEDTCAGHAQRMSMTDFLGEPRSCAMAQEVVADRCQVCSGCSAHGAGCGILELPPTVPPTTTIPLGGACKSMCDMGGHSATCEDRIAWSVANVFTNKPDACTAAHKMVLSQCAVCSKCSRSSLSCVDPETLAAEKAAEREEKAAAEADGGDLFDCDMNFAVWSKAWSGEKKGWCCEHKDRGCSDRHVTDVRFRQKFDGSLRSSRLGGGGGGGMTPLLLTALALLAMAAGCAAIRAAARRSPREAHLPALLRQAEASDAIE